MAGAFALVYTPDPPSAELFNKTVLKGAAPYDIGKKVRVKRPSWDECEGIIVATGK